MKILWLSHNIPYPPKGGVLQRNYNLVKEIAKYNKIFLVAFNQKALLPTDADIKDALNALKKYCEEIEVIPLPSEETKWGKKRLLAKSIFTKKPYTVNWNQSNEMKKLVEKVTCSFNPDLIHYDTVGLAEYYNPSYDGPQVLNHHNIESAMMLRRYQKEKNILKRLYFYQEAKKIEQYEKKYCGLFHANLTVSEDDGVILKRLLPEIKIEIISNGVDTAYFCPTKGKTQKISLIFGGGMGWYPNRDAMLWFADEIWPLIKKEYPDIKITVIGRKPPDKLIKLSKDDSNFIVTGYVDDVRPYFEEALIYVCPIRDGGGTRLKILDALSMGKPIVATTIAVEGIKVIPNKHVLIADAPEQFVAQIVKLIEDKDLREMLSVEGRKLVEENYDWAIIGKKLNNIYEMAYTLTRK